MVLLVAGKIEELVVFLVLGGDLVTGPISVLAGEAPGEATK